jgi:hypothetical protein
MDQKHLIKQFVDIQKNAFDNGFNAIVALQDQAENMMNSFLEQATWIPEEGKGAIFEWSKMYKKGRDDFKKAVNDGYKKAESFLNASIRV